MKKSRIIALLTAVAMIMSVVPALASGDSSSGYFVDEDGVLYEKSGNNLIPNADFENGTLTGLTDNAEYYAISTEGHESDYSLQAIKSTKGSNALTFYVPVENASDSYYFSFWYKNNDTVGRKPRITFAFTDASKTIPTEEDDFTEATNAWIQAGDSTNDDDIPYSVNGEWQNYSTVLRGNGNADACKWVVLNIYNLTKDVAFVDDFELYTLSSSEYSAVFAEAVAEWEKQTIPGGPLAGYGTLELPREVKADGVLVEWSSTSDTIDAETGDYCSANKEELAVLTARLYVEDHYDTIYYEYEYPYIVKSMLDPYVDWIESKVFGPLGTSVSGDIELPPSHTITNHYPAEFVWECSKPDILSSKGKFTEPLVSTDIDITVTINCNGGSTSLTKRFKALGGNLIPEGLVMYYDFEKAAVGNKIANNAKVGKSYTATLENVAIVDGYAKLSSGTITLPSNYGTEFTDNYTVALWVRADASIVGTSDMYRFFDFGGASKTSQFLRFSENKLAFMDRATSGDGSNFAFNVVANGFADTWKHVALVYDFSGGDQATASLYVDGQFVTNSGTYSALTRSLSQAATGKGYFGRTHWYGTTEAGSNPDFVGDMDEIRMYNRVLSQSEIQTLYNETRPTVTATITIQYFDTEGNKLRDDVTTEYDVNQVYDVPASYKVMPSSSDDQYRYTYKYISTASTDSIKVSNMASENICELVFELEKKPKTGNMLDNPSFETGVEGWTSNNNGAQATVTGWVRSNEQAHSGSYALKRVASAGGASADNLGTYIPIESGKVYRLSFWEYAGQDVPAEPNHMMSAACVTRDNTSPTNTPSNHLIQYGGYSSWNYSGARDQAYSKGWNEKVIIFDTTGATDANYIFIAYAWGEYEFYIDDFYLKEGAEPPVDVEDPDINKGEKLPVIIRTVDTEGNVLRDDIIEEAYQSDGRYTVPLEYRTLENKVDGDYTYRYSLVPPSEDGESGSKLTTGLSIVKENICTLVFEVLKTYNVNLITNGSFEDENGNFSVEHWNSAATGQQFGSYDVDGHCYAINATSSITYDYWGSKTVVTTSMNTEIPDGKWVFGTKWNDGATGTCSIARFVPVQEGKKYLVSYDYKHKSANVSLHTIRTTFQKSTNISASDGANYNAPQSLSTDWQKNSFTIEAPTDGYIYFHFYNLGDTGEGGGNSGNGPYWFFDNFEIYEVVTFENKITYENGNASIVAADGTTGYVVQAIYDTEGALTDVIISEEYTFSKETPVVVPVTLGAKVMVLKSITSLEPIAPAIFAK